MKPSPVPTTSSVALIRRRLGGKSSGSLMELETLITIIIILSIQRNDKYRSYEECTQMNTNIQENKLYRLQYRIQRKNTFPLREVDNKYLGLKGLKVSV